MAKLISYETPELDPREALYRKLQEAPISHAEAVLDAYEVLQLLREKGLLELAKTSLGSGEELVELVAEIVEGKEFVSFSRNATILVKLLGGINPAVLGSLQNDLVQQTKKGKIKRPGLFSFLFAIFSADGRHALGVFGTLLKTLGRSLPNASIEQAKDVGKKVYRHEVFENSPKNLDR